MVRLARRFYLVKGATQVDTVPAMFSYQVTNQPGAPIGVGGKIILTLFGLVFMGMGLFFVTLVARDAMSGLQTWSWQKTDCAIIASGVS